MMEREKAQELMRSLAREYANSQTKHVTLLYFAFVQMRDTVIDV